MGAEALFLDSGRSRAISSCKASSWMTEGREGGRVGGREGEREREAQTLCDLLLQGEFVDGRREGGVTV